MTHSKPTAGQSAEIDALVADLIACGVASSPEHALAMLARAGKELHALAADAGVVLAKVLPADSGPLHG